VQRQHRGLFRDLHHEGAAEQFMVAEHAADRVAEHVANRQVDLGVLFERVMAAAFVEVLFGI
jgi:hypothetical protein